MELKFLTQSELDTCSAKALRAKACRTDSLTYMELLAQEIVKHIAATLDNTEDPLTKNADERAGSDATLSLEEVNEGEPDSRLIAGAPEPAIPLQQLASVQSEALENAVAEFVRDYKYLVIRGDGSAKPYTPSNAEAEMITDAIGKFVRETKLG